MACNIYIPKRYILVVLAHFGFLFISVLRLNLNVLMRSMVNCTHHFEEYELVENNETSHHHHCNSSMETEEQEIKFNWDKNHQDLILNVFFYGYIVTQIPAGWLANRYGGKLMFVMGILITCILTLLSPLVARTDIYLFLALRVVQGLAEGVTAPAMHAMMAKWAVPSQRTRMVTYAYSGISSGTILAFPLCRLLAESKIGWAGSFYVFGSLGLGWCLVWMLCAFRTPLHHPTIAANEKNYITDSLKECSSNTRRAVVPWNEILLSIRVWAIITAHFSYSWIWNFMLTGLPMYFLHVLELNREQTEMLLVLTFVAGLLANLGGPVIADFLIMRRLTVTKTRRLFGILGFYITALFLIVVSSTHADQTNLSVICIVVATAFLCLNNSSFNVNHLDVAPRFAGVLAGLTNTAGAVAACTSPLVTIYFTHSEPTSENFSRVFLLAAGIAVIGGTFFNCFATGEQQKWNDLKKVDGVDDGYDNEGIDVDKVDLPAYAFYTTSHYL